MLLHVDVDILANMDNSVVEAVVVLGLDLDLYPRQLDLVVAAVDAMLCNKFEIGNGDEEDEKFANTKRERHI